MPATLKTVTLGCRVNQYETELVRQALVTIGYRDAQEDQPADLCVVNTCTVTAEGDAKSRQTIRRLARSNPDARIVVMGCYATRAPDEVSRLPGVSDVMTDKREIPDLLGRFGVVDVPTGLSSFGCRKRAYVKVQDGCMLDCSFCIIPKVRPRVTSRPVEDILAEVARMVENGHREVVLTGIHLGHYGVDLNRGKPRSEWVRLADLVRRLAELSGGFRVRLSSIEATEVTRDLVAAMAENADKVCPHLHVSMQSGSDRVFARMRRRWGARRFIDRCRLVAESLDLPAFTTDVIVGFPGETEADFQETLSACEEVGFSKIHVFSFSPRKGTDAARLSDQIAPQVKAERRARLLELEARLRRRYFECLLGRRLEVLVERAMDDASCGWLGTACRYMPVLVDSMAAASNPFTSVIATSVEDAWIVGGSLDSSQRATR